MTNRSGGTRPRPSAAVYRRRRLVVGVLAVIAIAGLVTVIALVVNTLNKPQASNSGSPSATNSNATSPTPTPATASTAAKPVCDQSKVTVKASTDATSYQAGKDPVFTLTVSNSGTIACEVNVGTSQMEYLVLSGSDRIFSSKDCQQKPSDLKKTIAPGASEKAVFPWQRNRSVEGCGAVAAKPGVGANAQYTLTVKLGDRTSSKAVFTLLS